MSVRRVDGARILPLLAHLLAWFAVGLAWLAAAPSALAATEILRLTEVARDPGVVGVLALLVLAAVLGVAGRQRPRHRRR